MTHPAEGKREQIARAIYAVSCRWIAPNFPEGHKLQTFDELGDRERRLNLEYADAALAQLSQGGKDIHSCGAESNRHSGAVGMEKRAEQSNPGGGHALAPKMPNEIEKKAGPDEPTPGRPLPSPSGNGDTKIVYIKRWRTLVPLPAKYADEIVEALRSPAESVPWQLQAAQWLEDRADAKTDSIANIKDGASLLIAAKALRRAFSREEKHDDPTSSDYANEKW